MIDKQFIVERQGRQFVLYAGLLDLAHSQGLRAIRTRLVQVPSDDNALTAIVSAEVETERGTFSGIGDASPANVSRAMLTCTIRLAETRAKARALRDAVNVGVAALEELGDSEPEPTEHRPNLRVVAEVSTPTDSGEAATPAQRRAITTLARQRGVDLDRAGVDVEQLTKVQASTLISRWQQEATATR